MNDQAILNALQAIFLREGVLYNPQEVAAVLAHLNTEEREFLEQAVKTSNEDDIALFFKDEITLPVPC